MHGPPLTIAEIAELLARQADVLTTRGVSQPRAIAEIADCHGIEPAVVRRLICRHERPSTDREAA